MPRFLLSNKAVIGALAAIALVIMGIGYSSSLWFLRGGWGPLDAETEFGYSNSHEVTKFFAGQGESIQNLTTAAIGSDQENFRRIAYLKDESGEYMALIPRFTRQFTTKATLQASGWNVSRIGWIVLASRINQPSLPISREYSLWNGIIAEAKAITSGKLPITPLFFFRTQQKDAVPFAVYASGEKGKIHLSASIDGFEYSMPKRSTTSDYKIAGDNKLIVALPSSVLVSISREFIDAIDTSVAEGLRFKKTIPHIFSGLPKGEDIYLLQADNEVAIGVRMRGEEFGNAIQSIMNKEQGQRHPKKRGFALPDRSMGYEYVRGVTNVGFAPSTNTTNCLPSQKYDETIFLCGKQEAAVLASSEAIGVQLLEFMASTPKGDWRGYVSGEYPIYFFGSNNAIEGWIDGI